MENVEENATLPVPIYYLPFSKIFFCYSIWQNLYSDMQNEISHIHFHTGLPSMETLTEWGSLTGHNILVLDDLMMEAVDSSEIFHLMCEGLHHHQITVIHILQSVFHQGKSMRSASVNAHYFILMNNKRDKNQILTLGKQIFPGKTNYFLDSFEKSTSLDFDYLLFDICPGVLNIFSYEPTFYQDCPLSSTSLLNDPSHCISN